MKAEEALLVSSIKVVDAWFESKRKELQESLHKTTVTHCCRCCEHTRLRKHYLCPCKGGRCLVQEHKKGIKINLLMYVL